MKNRNLIKAMMVCVFVLLAVSGGLAQRNGFKATVSLSEATFEFPVNPNYEYSWNSGGLTYAWNVKTVSPKCEIGFSLYTAQGAGVTEEGDINKVLAAGEFSAFCGGRVRNDIQVSGFANDTRDKLTIVLSGEKSIKLLFGTKPRHVSFERVLELFEKPKVSRVTVIYITRNTPVSPKTGGGQKIIPSSTKKVIASDLLSQLSKSEARGLKFDKLTVVEDYANLGWSTTHEGGQAILRFEPSAGRWVLIEFGGGFYDVDSLVNLGIPRPIAVRLCGGSKFC